MNKSLVVLAFCVTLASPAFAETGDSTAIREITLGTAVPAGQSFVLILDDAKIDAAYPEWAPSLMGPWTNLATKEQFRAVVRDVAGRKLAVMFPDGLPRDAASGVEIKVRLGKSPEIIVGC